MFSLSTNTLCFCLLFHIPSLLSRFLIGFLCFLTMPTKHRDKNRFCFVSKVCQARWPTGVVWGVCSSDCTGSISILAAPFCCMILDFSDDDQNLTVDSIAHRYNQSFHLIYFVLDQSINTFSFGYSY